ncbi:MAG: hypothetical protein V3V78_00310 [Candidatus Woesearchaeota archaeon]
MAVPGKVMWAELQKELGETGLDVSVGAPSMGSPWPGTIDELNFIMTVSPRDESDGYRDFLVISLFGQDEDKVVEGLTQFMGYSPFCKYQNRLIDEAAATKDWKVTGTYEWDKDNPKGRLEELAKDENIYEVKKIKAGFQAIDTLKTDMAQVYHEFTPDIIAKWEAAVQENPDAEWTCQKVADILPFLKTVQLRVQPRFGKNQSLFGFSIISLDRSYKDEPEVVAYGLEPLVKAEILTDDEASKISDWYKNTQPSWDSNNTHRFEKTFKLGDHRYRLSTDCYRGCRDLNLQLVG